MRAFDKVSGKMFRQAGFKNSCGIMCPACVSNSCKMFRQAGFEKLYQRIWMAVCLLLAISVLAFSDIKASAASSEYVNSETGYGAYIDDGAELLTEDEAQQLLEIMKPITEYGNAIYLTTDHHSYNWTSNYVETYYLQEYGAYVSGIVYCVDNWLEYDYIYTEGDLYDVINSSYADTITDNVYMYSAKEQWYQGAAEAFTEAASLLEGKRIAQPMKYICNAFLALLISLLINFMIINSRSKLKAVSTAEMVEGSMKAVRFGTVSKRMVNQTKVYAPRSSGGGGGGGHGGHGGGGGGHHGGGGGHSH